MIGFMTENTSEWNEIGRRLESLGLKLQYHAEQAISEDRAKVDDALQTVREAIEEAFGALRGVVSDPAVRDDVKTVAEGVAGAISSTLRGVGQDIRDRVEQHK
jgi:hypothetical protein